MLWEHLENSLAFVEVYDWILGELNVSLNGWSCRGVDVVQSSFGHLVKNVVKFRRFYFSSVIVEVSNYNVEHRVDKFFPKLGEFLIGTTLRVRQTGLKIKTKM